MSTENFITTIPENNPKRELLVTTTCHIDPKVTETSNKIYETIEKERVNKVIKPVGNFLHEKTEIEINGPVEPFSPDADDMERAAIEINDISNDTISHIKEIAKNNPVTNELIENSKRFFHENKPLIEKQVQDLVAFYSIKDKKPFFFISPAEARLAIDHVKQVRSGFLQDKEDKEEEEIKDLYVRSVKDKYTENNKFEKFNAISIGNEDDLRLNSLNMMFANMEKDNNVPDAISVAPLTYATIRLWGQTVYEEYKYKVIKSRGVFGKIWTAEIYVSSKIPKSKLLLIDSIEKRIVENTFIP